MPKARTNLLYVALRIFLLVLLLAGHCRAGSQRESNGKSDWTGKEIAKVVEYRFQGPEGDVLSLISNDGLNGKQLKKYAVKSAQLTDKQVATLLNSTFSTTHRVGTAACYDPHHIFVFYAKDGRPLRAIEICFECTTVVTTPKLSDKLENHHDFVALARLTEELGLWSEGMTVEQFTTLMQAREPVPEE